jgi:hypothetical protein
VDERNQRCKAPQEVPQLKPGGYGLGRGAYLPLITGGELLGRYYMAGREATVNACGVAVAMPLGQSWPPHPLIGSW